MTLASPLPATDLPARIRQAIEDAADVRDNGLESWVRMPAYVKLRVRVDGDAPREVTLPTHRFRVPGNIMYEPDVEVEVVTPTAELMGVEGGEAVYEISLC